jgi:CSLREA domain-containing protein
MRNAALSIGVAVLVAAPAANAKTFEVTRQNDPAPGACKPNDCSLREAISAANAHGGADEVVLPGPGAHYDLSRPNQTALSDNLNDSGDLDVADPVTISHPGKGMATIDANGIDRPLEVLEGAATKLVKIRLTGGDNVLQDPAKTGKRRRGPLSSGYGGGIQSVSALKVVRSAVVDNHGAQGGGGIEVGGVPFTLKRSTVSGNSTNSSIGGGLYVYNAPVHIIRSRIDGNHSANAGGGIATDDVNLNVTKSTFANNTAESAATGVYLYFGKATIKQTTISGNIGQGSSGGGLEADFGELTMVNSTVAGNSAEFEGGGIDLGYNEIAHFNSITVAGNTADADDNASGPGGGIFVTGGMNGASATIVNSIIAGNHVGTLAGDCDGAFISGGGNLVATNGGCTGFAPPEDLIGGNAKLGVLKSNGGPTETLALKKGSDAIGLAVKADAPKRDQRGHRRDKHPDSGAFERG